MISFERTTRLSENKKLSRGGYFKLISALVDTAIAEVAWFLSDLGIRATLAFSATRRLDGLLRGLACVRGLRGLRGLRPLAPSLAAALGVAACAEINGVPGELSN